MAIPTQRANVVCHKLDNSTDLGFTLAVQSPMGNNATQTSTNITTPSPEAFLVLCKLVSGAVTIDASVHAGTPNFGSPDATITINNTALGGYFVNTTSSKLQAGLKLTAGASGAQFSAFGVYCLGAVNSLQGWPDFGSAVNAFGSTIAGTSGAVAATGSGVVANVTTINV